MRCPHGAGVLPVRAKLAGEAAEKPFTFAEKVSLGLSRAGAPPFRTDGYRIRCGRNPWLSAHPVKGVYVQTHEESGCRETLHWTEFAVFSTDPKSSRLIQTVPERSVSETVDFDQLWDRLSTVSRMGALRVHKPLVCRAAAQTGGTTLLTSSVAISGH